MRVVKNYELSVREVEVADMPDYYGTKLITAGDCGTLAKRLIGDKAQEHFVAFLMNLSQEVLGYQLVAMGRQDACPVDMRVLFRAAVSLGASFIAISHNHPEGNPTPSNMDLRVTDMVSLAGEVLGIPLLDHVIVTPKGMVSMRQHGFMLPPRL